MPRLRVLGLASAIACAGLAVLVWLVAFHSGIGGRADEALLQRLGRWPGTTSYDLATAVATLCNPPLFAVLAGLVVTTAVATRGIRGALLVGVVLVVPNLVTQILKQVTAVERDGIARGVDAASWPSGHATAAMALALCAIAVAPAGWRAVTVVLGGGLAAGVGLSVVMLGWHFPSDVAGGYLVAAAGASLGLSLLETRAAPRGHWLPARG